MSIDIQLVVPGAVEPEAFCLILHEHGIEAEVATMDVMLAGTPDAYPYGTIALVAPSGAERTIRYHRGPMDLEVDGMEGMGTYAFTGADDQAMEYMGWLQKHVGGVLKDERTFTIGYRP